MTTRMTWPELCRSAKFRGLWVAIDNCRYDHETRQPVEGDVVEVRAIERPVRLVEPEGSQAFWDLFRQKVELLPS